MLIRTDPFRALDQLTQQVLGTASRPTAMPLEAWRQDGEFIVEFDLPGVDPETIDVGLERNVLTVRAERRSRRPEGAEALADERTEGVLGRELILGDALDTGQIQAHYQDGVLTLRVPVAEEAKPRKVAVQTGGGKKEINA
ncbi:Hsp20/alpha crystallin family protein [Sinomonas atrocyanea]|uniref:Hsp20/alpha crystallin family protein n=1 Tax=Sinomonas atrocyanea TaxID=37927 RepID=UPI003D96C189